MSFKEEYVEINGIQQYFLHYCVPSEIVAIILHGGPGQSEAHLAHYLSENWGFCNIVYYDQRGTGKTQIKNRTKSEDITLDTLVVDLKQTIGYLKRKYKTDKLIIIGHSWGSVLGTQYILKYPSDCLAYVGYGQVVDMVRGEIIRKKEKRGSGIDIGKLLKIIFKSPIFERRDVIAALSGAKTNKNLMKTLQTYSIWDVTEYQLPIYYILGRDDWQVPSVLAAEYFEKIGAPKKRLYFIENAGHMTDFDNPAEFSAALLDVVRDCVSTD
jgi:pimeloyl-ACP methyl ester carboxylesterase